MNGLLTVTSVTIFCHDTGEYSRQFYEHILKVLLLKSNLLLIKSEQIMLLLKDFTAFFYNSCETIHAMNSELPYRFNK